MNRCIAVDLEGTLAEYHGPHNIGMIGPPIPLMLERVKKWISEGITVKIFTARACVPELIPPIKEWLHEHGIGQLEVTNIKDFSIVEFWDDRAVSVILNTGKVNSNLEFQYK